MTAAAALRQLGQPDPAGFVTVEEAAQITGESLRTWRWRAKVESVAARKGGRQSLAVKAPTARGNGWLLHRSIDKRLSKTLRPSERDSRARDSLLMRYPEHAVDLAYRKAYWLIAWAQAGGRRRDAQRIVVEAKRIEGEEFAIGVRSLELWRKAYNTVGQAGAIRGIESLIDGRAIATLRDDAEAPAPKGRSADAIAYFYRVFHSQGSQTAKTSHDATLSKARKKGWQWPAGYAATTRWLREYSDLALDCLHRDGPSAYSHRFMGHLELDYGALVVAERYVLDHSQADYWCRTGSGAGSKVVRPWATCIIDARSRMLVGHFLGGHSAHQDSILRSMTIACRDWAVPEKVHIDQGKDFTSALLTGVTKAERRKLRRELGPDWRDKLRHQSNVKWLGVFGELDISVAEATPYHPWAKALIEIVFRRMHNELDRSFFSYTGRSSATKPECSEAMRAADDLPTLKHCRERFGEWVELYNHSPHCGLNGKAPIQVWRTADTLRRAIDDQLVPLLQARGVYRVGAQGVAFRIAGETYSYGANSVRLRRYAGRDVFVTLDPDDCSTCIAYTAEGHAQRYIDRLESNKRIPANTSVDELREAIKTVRHRNKDFARAGRQAPQRMRDATHEVAALRREQRKEALRATGTDDARAHTTNVRLVHTGFEVAASRATTAPPRRDRKSRDLADAAAALSYGHERSEPEATRPRATLEMIAPINLRNGDPAKDDGSETVSTDAEKTPKPDLLGLVAGARHERTERSE